MDFLYFLLFIVTPGSLSPIGRVLSSSSPLDLGYRQLYNLQFSEAHKTFQDYRQAHPDDPFGSTSDAAAYLFEEFDRLGVLQSELFVDDKKFKKRERPAPDPLTKEAFNKALEESNHIAERVLKYSPDDSNALFAKAMNLGLRCDYAALVEKRDLASLAYMKSAGLIAERLLAINPRFYDAYLAVGVENYVLGLNPAPVRWFLRLYGVEADKDRGLRNLQLTAEKGHYLLPYARLLLAVAALRGKDRAGAKLLLQSLSQEFPNNRLYQHELAGLQ